MDDTQIRDHIASLVTEEHTLLEHGENGKLSDDDREIVLMRHHEGLSNQEVARALDLTEAAASMRYLRALRRLRWRASASSWIRPLSPYWAFVSA